MPNVLISPDFMARYCPMNTLTHFKQQSIPSFQLSVSYQRPELNIILALYGRMVARPKLRNKQGEYSVIGMSGQVLKRGHDLKTVLRVLEPKMIRAVN